MKKYRAYVNIRFYMRGTRTFIFSFLLAVKYCIGDLDTVSAVTASGFEETIPCPNCKNGWLTCNYC